MKEKHQHKPHDKGQLIGGKGASGEGCHPKPGGDASLQPFATP